MEQREVHLDAQQIRVLAHPLRFRLLGRLRLDGPATATRLAQALDTNTGATSYHLRQLADAGLVVEEERPGGGRERWWRSAHEVSSWQRDNYTGDPDATAASDWLEGRALELMIEHAQAWHGARDDESPEWRQAANFSDYCLDLSPEQMNDMEAELAAVVERYRQAEPAAGARQIFFYMYALPRVDK